MTTHVFRRNGAGARAWPFAASMANATQAEGPAAQVTAVRADFGPICRLCKQRGLCTRFWRKCLQVQADRVVKVCKRVHAQLVYHTAGVLRLATNGEEPLDQKALEGFDVAGFVGRWQMRFQGE